MNTEESCLKLAEGTKKRIEEKYSYYVMSALECKPNVSGESTIGKVSMNAL